LLRIALRKYFFQMLPKHFKKLIEDFAGLPSVGPKMAERIVLFLFKQKKEKIEEFSQDLSNFIGGISFCRQCFYISENGLCVFCSDPKRSKEIICVVEDPLDVIAIEKTGKFKGLYHVLGGVISVMKKEEAKNLKLKELLERAKKKEVKEILIATNPTTDGETTALYLARLLRPLGKKITRLARGLSTGGDIEYVDQITLSNALEGRREM